MLGKRFARIVEECLHRLDRGENLPDVLADFPAEAEQLKPLLLVAMASRSMAFPTPSQTARRLGKNQMLLEMDQVASPGIGTGRTLVSTVKGWTTRLINTRRAQLLIQPAPSYRLAIVALLLVFGSGLFFYSASASPGDLFNSIIFDFQQILGFMNIDQSDDVSNGLRRISIYGGDYFAFGTVSETKLTTLLDIQDDQNPDFSQVPPGPEITPADNMVPEDIPDDHADDDDTVIGPIILSPDTPHPASFVNDVVSDTAKEKNPVWDQLPFNQTDPENVDDCEDQDEDCDADDDSNNGPPSWVIDLKESKIDDDDDDSEEGDD